MGISKKAIQFILVLLLTSVSSICFANNNVSEVDNSVIDTLQKNQNESFSHKEEEFNASDLINSHIGDSHEFHIADWDGHPISFYLPVILWTENGLTIFSSSKFHHDNSGHHIVSENGLKFVG
jgi:F-type H+-transporting ATPase subunit a